jgi:hypothetical protein
MQQILTQILKLSFDVLNDSDPGIVHHKSSLRRQMCPKPQDHQCGAEALMLDFQLKVHRIIVATILPYCGKAPAAA